VHLILMGLLPCICSAEGMKGGINRSLTSPDIRCDPQKKYIYVVEISSLGKSFESANTVRTVYE
jgi:hypothetical protein